MSECLTSYAVQGLTLWLSLKIEFSLDENETLAVLLVISMLCVLSRGHDF